jgi:peptidoglycan/xylan/chitin deacetylase (PgdA/CDA1 family)
LIEMQARDVAIGSHTRNHVWLANEPEEVVAREVEGSRRSLESRLGVPVEHFAYPDGCFNRAAVRAVATCGYRFAYTTCSHRDARHPFLTIPRRGLWERSSVDAAGQFVPEILDCQTQGLFVGPRACTPRSHR